MNRTQPARLAIGRSLVFAGLFLQTSIVVKSMSPAELSHEMSQRLLGLWFGFMVAYFSNSIPKERPSAACERSTGGQRLRRFSAWSLTMGGLGFALLSAFAPYEQSRPLAVSFLGACMLLVIFRLASVWRRSSGASPTRSR